MLDFVRKHTRVIQIVFLPLIAVGFVAVGVEGYSRFMDESDIIATIDGQKVYAAQWDAMQRNEADRIRTQMPDVDSKLFDTPAFKKRTLDALIQEQVLSTAVGRQHLMIADNRLARLIATDPQVAPLLTPEGKWNKPLLEARGRTVAQLEAQLRAQYSVQQVVAGVAGSGFVPAQSSRLALEALLQRREVQLARVDVKTLVDSIRPTDEDLRKYYDDSAHTEALTAPEQADVEYLVLDLSAVESTIKVDEAELRNFYEQNIKRYTTPEERRASHILVKFDSGATEDQRKAAKAKADDLLSKIKKNPALFAELAKKNSDDPVSAPQGGDLDYVGRGAIQSKAFEDAVFALKPQQISEVVESEMGYHIIMLAAVRGGDVRPFESVRAEIDAEIKKQQAQRQFAEAAERFTNLVYEQADSLKPAADALKLTIQLAKAVPRTPSAGATGPMASDKFLQALFEPANVKNKRNTEAIEMGSNQLIAGRITQYSPARKRSFDEVKELIRVAVISQKAMQAARDQAQQQMQAWKASPDAAKLASPITVSRQLRADLAQPVLEAAMKMPTNALPGWQVVEVPGQGAVVLKVNKVLPSEAPAQQASAASAQYVQLWAAAEAKAYLNALKSRYKVTISPAAQAKLDRTAQDKSSQDAPAP